MVTHRDDAAPAPWALLAATLALAIGAISHRPFHLSSPRATAPLVEETGEVCHLLRVGILADLEAPSLQALGENPGTIDLLGSLQLGQAPSVTSKSSSAR